ncbi:uncharacterized protein KY384_005086 [Bacidia gigantensis]|uniref:uncharacterized protein n=1 Tax=Bacidia gigantensis TaxID=2732470 RepID=UPI001D050C95|nr:uncharacterized protein KY384_005086 [Bacidia gigantensis]KAG8530583.1 hypothetical protein KY384_005086 [Bacidia gigantensis]
MFLDLNSRIWQPTATAWNGGEVPATCGGSSNANQAPLPSPRRYDTYKPDYSLQRDDTYTQDQRPQNYNGDTPECPRQPYMNARRSSPTTSLDSAAAQHAIRFPPDDESENDISEHYLTP